MDIWHAGTGAGAKVLSLWWSGEDFTVLGFRRGAWEQELLALDGSWYLPALTSTVPYLSWMPSSLPFVCSACLDHGNGTGPRPAGAPFLAIEPRAPAFNTPPCQSGWAAAGS